MLNYSIVLKAASKCGQHPAVIVAHRPDVSLKCRYVQSGKRRLAMRRVDKEITSGAEIEDIIRRGRVCHLGLCDGGIPYVVPVNYGYAAGCLYVHSAREGRKIEILRRNNLVSFAIYVDECIVESATACRWTTRYRSVMGSGKAFLVEDPAAKEGALRLIIGHYSAGEYRFDPAMIDHVLIIRVIVDELTGKKSA
jgi:nitroimidazol reductase NimA-like FMN-containing flavoprotein (pyridoxamine 5'-phosphate oxidase superfamily)